MKRLRFAITAGSALVLATSAGAQERSDRIPPGHVPPPGMCRIWINGVPAGRQPRETDCETARRNAPANSRIIYGGDSQGRVSNDPRYPGSSNGTYDPRYPGSSNGTYDPRYPRTGTSSGTYDPRYDPRSGRYDPRLDPRSGRYDPRNGSNDERRMSRDELKRRREWEKVQRKRDKEWKKARHHGDHDEDDDDDSDRHRNRRG